MTMLGSPLPPPFVSEGKGAPVMVRVDPVTGELYVKLASGISIGGAVDQGAAGASPWPISDRFVSGEVLADQAGAGGVLTFTFASPVQLIEVLSQNADARLDPYGGTPSATAGIPCLDGVPKMMPVPSTSSIKVYAPSGTVSVHGQRY